MTRPRPRIGSELLPVILILVCLGGAWCLVLAMHLRGSSARNDRAATAVAPLPGPVAIAPAPVPARKPQPAPDPQPPLPPPEDPTIKALAGLRLAQTEQVLEAQRADRKAEALEAARQSALADSERWRRREAMVRAQIDALTDQATRLGDEMNQVALERDVLARERDAEKAALARARTRSSYAVLPHKGPNGTWRRPIILECHNGMATLRPDGTSFSMLELSGLLGARTSPIVVAVAREIVRAERQTSPDGAPIVPYIFFVIRPDGIRPYYNARAQLEPLGIAFGYELVDQDMEIDYPDLDHLDEWDGSVPIRPRSTEPPPPPVAVADSRGSRSWSGSPRADAIGERSDDPVNSFVWPTRPSGGSSGRGSEIGAGRGEPDSTGDGHGGPGSPSESPSRSGSPATAARGGLGRGGSGVDPFPVGVPVMGRGQPGDSSGSPDPGTDRDAHGVEPRFGRRPGLVPVDPEGMPGLVSPDAAGGTSGRLAAGPDPGGRRSGIGSGSESESGSPTGEPVGPSAHGNPADPSPGLAPSTGVGSPASSNAGRSPIAGLSGHFDPNRGAPPSLSQLARLAGTAGANAANPFGVPMPLPASNAERMDREPGSGSGGAGMREGEGPSTSSTLARLDRDGPTKVDVPFEIVVACSPGGVVIHPGGYRLSSKALKSKDDLLMKHLRTIVQARRQVDPSIRPRPSIRFLIEPGGSEAYRDARRQTMLSGQDWPIALQVSDSDILDNFPREPW